MLINVLYLLVEILFGITMPAVLIIYVLGDYKDSIYTEKHITKRKANINNDQ